MTENHTPCPLGMWASYSVDYFLLSGGNGIFREHEKIEIMVKSWENLP